MTTASILAAGVRPVSAASLVAPRPMARPGLTPQQTANVGRNDLCPCGSGKKYKKCCGKGLA